MKKYLLLFVFAFLTVSFAHAQSRWNIGVQNGLATNIAKFKSGDETANALFTSDPTAALNFAVTFRYKISEKFAFQSGLNFTEFGFTYGIAKDYSLLKPCDRSNEIRATTCISGVPVMALMNTPLNCSNIRFVFGLGFTIRGIDSKWNDENVQEIETNEDGNARTTVMTAESKSTTAVSPAATWMIGIEKVLRNGNGISLVYNGNQGFNTVAESTVKYTIDNKNYTHTFINRGSFVSFSLAYNFNAFGTRRAMKALKNGL